jgi:DNA-binding MarR family transcriptional regulator
MTKKHPHRYISARGVKSQLQFVRVGSNNKVTISARPSRASQLRVLVAVARAAMNSKALPLPEGGRRLPLSTLLVIALAEEEHRPVNIDYLRRELRLTQASTSRQVAAQVEAGALQYHEGEDTRKTFVRLTKRGHLFIDEVLDAMRKQVITEREKQATDEN